MEPFQKTWSDLYWISLENSGTFMYVMCYAIYYKPLDYMIVDSSSEIKDMSSAQSLLDSWYDNVDKCLWHKQRVFNLDLDTKCRERNEGSCWVDLQDDKYSDVDSFPVSLVQSAFWYNNGPHCVSTSTTPREVSTKCRTGSMEMKKALGKITFSRNGDFNLEITPHRTMEKGFSHAPARVVSCMSPPRGPGCNGTPSQVAGIARSRPSTWSGSSLDPQWSLCWKDQQGPGEVKYYEQKDIELNIKERKILKNWPARVLPHLQWVQQLWLQGAGRGWRRFPRAGRDKGSAGGRPASCEDHCAVGHRRQGQPVKLQLTFYLFSGSGNTIWMRSSFARRSKSLAS